MNTNGSTNGATNSEYSALDLNIERLKRDVLRASRELQPDEVRYLVDLYYGVQDFRIQMQAQIRASSQGGEPHEVLQWQFKQMVVMEDTVKAMLDVHTDRESTGMGQWLKGVYGIGPVIAAGLLAHVDITQCPTVGHLWRFAGLDPTSQWEAKTKRPWNAKLKVLTWKAGQSFLKFSGRPDCYYGQVYVRRKQYEIDRNERGELADQAAKTLIKKGFKNLQMKAIYESGKLPPAHLDARARRYAVKLFLSHFWEEWYRRHHGTEPPLPYPIAIGGHAHYITAPA